MGMRSSWGSERSTAVKKQADINGLLPTLGVGPFHLFRLPLDLRSDVLRRGNCHFSQGKVRKHFRTVSQDQKRKGRHGMLGFDLR
jgi:hypothetical protein